LTAQLRDVVVIGGGPAGSLTAARLAARGFDVVLLEEHAAIGAPVHCTGLLGLEAFDEFGLPRDLILSETGAAQFWGAAGQSVTIRSDRVQAAIIDRAALDVWLADRAAGAGVEIQRERRAEAVEVGSSSVRVAARGADRPIAARACVLACGANYRFHRALGLGMPDVFLQSAQLETAFPETPEVEVRFGREVAPSGFAWLVPFRRGPSPHARIGLMAETKGRDRFEAFLASICGRAGVGRETVPAPRLKMLPLGPISRTYANRVVAVGDAAGLVKPTTGGGIYYGLLSGAIAADVLGDALLGDRLGEQPLRRYETLWRRRLGREIKVGLAFRRIAARLNDESIDALIDLARVNGIVPLLQRNASFNWHSAAAVALLGHPSFRKIVFKSWTRGSARPPGLSSERL
jgi:geranylgeranyl reductase family protein